MRIAVFISHPIQYFSPLWQALAKVPEVRLKVYYYSERSAKAAIDPGFGVSVEWDIDLLGGYESVFLPRHWPTKDVLDHTWKGVNGGLLEAVGSEEWDAVLISGYIHLNNWVVAASCARRGIPIMCFSDVSLITELLKSPIKRTGKRPLVWSFLKMMSAYLAVGNHSRDYFIHYGADPKRVFITPYVVDAQRLNRRVREAGEDQKSEILARYAVPRDRKLVLFCGKLIERKRPLDLVAAMKRLRCRDAMAVFIGDGPLANEIRKEGGSDVVVTGFVNQRDIPLLFASGRVLVLPSSYEAYGVVVTEAAALGVPSIVSDRCGCYGEAATVRPGQTGWVFPCGDVAALASALDDVLADDTLRNQAGQKAAAVSEMARPEVVAATIIGAINAVRRS